MLYVSIHYKCVFSVYLYWKIGKYGLVRVLVYCFFEPYNQSRKGDFVVKKDFVISAALLVVLVIFFGCDEGMQVMKPVVATEHEDKGVPVVMEVNYYGDWQLIKPLAGMVNTGTTIYTKVAFSEAMQHSVSNEGDARPVFFYVIGEKETRYTMKQHDASGENFQSGDSKPLRDGTHGYLCKYTVQPTDRGTFTLKVGKASMDIAGNTLVTHYIHDVTLELRQPIIEVAADQDMLTEEEAYKKAQETVLRVNARVEILFQEFNPEPGESVPPEFSAEIDEIRIEEYGFGIEFINETLVDIYLEENPKPDSAIGVDYSSLVLAYLAITYQFPEEDEERHLQIFRERVRGHNPDVFFFGE